MAGNCALCGEKLSFFGGKMLVCGNQDEMFCSNCHDVLYDLENLERGAYLLEHGNPEHSDEMRAFIIKYTERAQKRQEFEPETRPCPNCQGEMALKIKNFRIGAYGDSLLGERYDVDLYACPECGKVEMYTANFAAVKRKAEEAAAKQAEKEAAFEQARKIAEDSRPVQQEFTSVRSGTKSGKKPPWER